MSINPFHSEELLKSASRYPVAKGDLPGHPFRGNQYQTAQAAADHFNNPKNFQHGTGNLNGLSDAELKKAIADHTKQAKLHEAVVNADEDTINGDHVVAQEANEEAAKQLKGYLRTRSSAKEEAADEAVGMALGETANAVSNSNKQAGIAPTY